MRAPFATWCCIAALLVNLPLHAAGTSPGPTRYSDHVGTSPGPIPIPEPDPATSVIKSTRRPITRNVFIETGFGVPHLFFLQGQAMLDKHFQLGFGYGLIPGMSLFASNLPLPEQRVPLQGGAVTVSTKPVMDAGYNTLLPFVRWFPRADNFYVQFSFTLLKATADIRGDLVDTGTGTTVGNIAGQVTVLQPLPMFSVGQIFVGKRWFLNVMIGMSFFFLGATSSVDLTTFIPDALGGNSGNQQAIKDLQNGISSSVDEATASLKSSYPVIPSISFSFGIFL